jgi:RND family efflux transporter MFP subunit
MITRIMNRFGLAACMAGVLVYTGCGESGSAANEAAAVEETRAVNVVTSVVQPREFTNHLRLVGEVKPVRRVVVSIEATGLVKRIEVEKGASVRQNAVLARLDDELLKAAADEAEAALNASGLTLRNQKRLLDQKALAESVYLDTRYRHDMNLARHQQAQTYLSKTVIRAPISGVVDSRNLEVGELATPGRELMDLVDIDRVKIEAGVPERHLKHVTDGTQATLTFPAYPDVVLEADISYIGTTLDPESRTIPIEITLDNPGHRLKPEMAVTIRVVKDNIPKAIVIPQDAVIDTDQGRIVFLADKNVARSVPVALGSTSGDQVLVTNGLSAGDSLIVVGHRNLVNGESIQVRNDRM